MTVPLLVAAWPLSSPRTRPFLFGLAGVHVMLWFGPGPIVLRTAYLGAVLAGSVATIIALARPREMLNVPDGPGVGEARPEALVQ